MPYTVFQVMKVFLIERHKIKVLVLLFLVELHQQIFTALKSCKFPSQTYLKGFVKFTIQSIHQLLKAKNRWAWQKCFADAPLYDSINNG